MKERFMHKMWMIIIRCYGLHNCKMWTTEKAVITVVIFPYQVRLTVRLGGLITG